MSEAAIPVPSDASATQKPAGVVVASNAVVVGRGSRADKRAALIEPVPDTAGGTGGTGADRTAELTHLLAEALTVLTIYAEVAVPVPSYRGAPMSAHAPRELVERIHRAIGA